MNPALINLGYLAASALFIAGLKGLAHPRSAPRGNVMGAIGMLIAVVLTLLDRRIVNIQSIVVVLALGTAIGATLAVKIRMTAMPQLVAWLNGLGGGASVFVAGVGLLEVQQTEVSPLHHFTAAAVISGIVGAVTFWGSWIAFAKLQALITEDPVPVSRHRRPGLCWTTTCSSSLDPSWEHRASSSRRSCAGP